MPRTEELLEELRDEIKAEFDDQIVDLEKQIEDKDKRIEELEEEVETLEKEAEDHKAFHEGGLYPENLDEEFKIDHFVKVWRSYSLDQIQSRLPETNPKDYIK
jgi:hypothetical protein